MRWKRTVAAAIATSCLVATVALALPRVGTTVPRATVQTLDGKTLDTRGLQGRTTLIFYEDKDATEQNKVLKDALKLQEKNKARKANVDVFAVADVSAWDFWPAKGFVKDAIEEQEKKSGHSIYCDWSGDFGKALGIADGKSNVLLIGPDKKVRVAKAGAVSTAVRNRIVRETTK
jgi:predicted transcriptional regulator